MAYQFSGDALSSKNGDDFAEPPINRFVELKRKIKN